MDTQSIIDKADSLRFAIDSEDTVNMYIGFIMLELDNLNDSNQQTVVLLIISHLTSLLISIQRNSTPYEINEVLEFIKYLSHNGYMLGISDKPYEG